MPICLHSPREKKTLSNLVKTFHKYQCYGGLHQFESCNKSLKFAKYSIKIRIGRGKTKTT